MRTSFLHLLLSVLILPLLLGCAAIEPELLPGARTIPIVSGSAAGWTLRPGPGQGRFREPTTIVINPEKQEFNIGMTPYPDIATTTLWIVPVKELKARFLIIQVQPVASASVPLPILYIDQNDHPTHAGFIRQRFQFEVDPRDQPGADPSVYWEGHDQPLRDQLFEKCDKDGIPELVENDVWKEGGTVTYFRFTAHKTFIPVRREIYVYVCDDNHPNGGFVMTSRKSLLK